MWQYIVSSNCNLFTVCGNLFTEYSNLVRIVSSNLIYMHCTLCTVQCAPCSVHCAVTVLRPIMCRNERMQQKTRFRDCIIYYWTHKEPSTRYSRRKRISGFWADDSQNFLRKCNRESRSSVERMADGEQEAQVVHSARRMEGHVPRSQSEGPSTRPCLSTIANRRQGKPLVFRASAGSMWYTRSVSGLS